MGMSDVNIDELVSKSTGTFEPLPKGDYQAQIEEVSDGSWPNGQEYTKIKFRITGPTHANRVHFEDFKAKGYSEKQQAFSAVLWSQVCEGSGTNGKDYGDMLGRRLTIRLGQWTKKTGETVNQLNWAGPPNNAPSAPEPNRAMAQDIPW